jgi:hypothetical protein
MEVIMRVAVLIAGGLIATAGLPGQAFAQQGYYAFGANPSSANPPSTVNHYVTAATLPTVRFTEGDVSQIAAWGEAGKCVVAKDRGTSIAYLNAPRGSLQAQAAAAKLDPAFDACLMGGPVRQKDNRALRRAALGDALGIKPAK